MKLLDPTLGELEAARVVSVERVGEVGEGDDDAAAEAEDEDEGDE